MDDNIIHTLVFFLDVLLPTKFSDEKKKKAPPKKKKTRAKKLLTGETTERLSDVDNNTITTNNKYTIDTGVRTNRIGQSLPSAIQIAIQ